MCTPEQNKESSLALCCPLQFCNETPKFLLYCERCGAEMNVNTKIIDHAMDAPIFINFQTATCAYNSLLHCRRVLTLYSRYCRQCEQQFYNNMSVADLFENSKAKFF
jgi:hypothetical protein